MTAQRRSRLIGLGLVGLLLIPLHITSLIASEGGIGTALPVLGLAASVLAITAAAVALRTRKDNAS